MHFNVTTTVVPPESIPPKPKSWDDWVSEALALIFGGLLLLLIVPLAAVAVLIIAFGDSLYQQLRRAFGWQAQQQTPKSAYALPVDMLRTSSVQLLFQPLVSTGIFPKTFEDWLEQAIDYDSGETADSQGVGQLCTTPEIIGLHGQLIGELCHKWRTGIFLQLFEPTNAAEGHAGTSWLVYLELNTLHWQRITEVGACYLESVPNDPELLRGWRPDNSQLLVRFSATAGLAPEALATTSQ